MQSEFEYNLEVELTTPEQDLKYILERLDLLLKSLQLKQEVITS